MSRPVYMEANLLQLLSIFKAVILAGSYTKAGAALGMPKSKVSRAITKLEEFLNLRLLTRTTRQLEMTQEGRNIYQNVLPLVDQFHTAIDTSRSQQAQLSGKIRFTAPEDFGVELLGRCCSEFRKLHPAISLELVVDNQHLDLVKEKLDLALRIGPLRSSSHLYAQKLGPVNMVIVCAGNWLQQDIKHPRQLLEIPFLSFSLNREGVKRQFFKDNERLSFEFKPYASSNNFFFLREMVVAHSGFAILPRFLAEEKILKGEIVQILPDWKLHQENLYSVTAGGRNLPLRIKVFQQFLARKLSPLI